MKMQKRFWAMLLAAAILLSGCLVRLDANPADSGGADEVAPPHLPPP